eukprot:TRINITY_DN124_c0_g1_i1.p1 TRINITY_DN124_c0_g1~~TRINITY_DN124_c0_g1_i1.p1  ORF type:complete len:239 (-),score=148.12 TRINITY_DN124_c0_g1_i1:35-661(-)
MTSLHGEVHDGIDDIAIVGLEGLDSLGAADASLLHDELDILGVESALVNLLGLDFLGLSLGSLGGSGSLLGSHDVLELLSSEGLLGGSDVLAGGLAENDVSLTALEDLGGVDEEELLALLEDDALNAGERLHAKLLHGLAALLLTTSLLGGSSLGSGSRSLKLGELLIRRFLLLVLNLLDGGSLGFDLGSHLSTKKSRKDTKPSFLFN